MSTTSTFITVPEIQEVLTVSESKAYRIVRTLNEELKKKGLRNQRASEGERQLTASQEYGIIYQDEFMEMTGNKVVTVEKDFSILKHVEPNDFVISMRSFQGGLEYSELSGSISSAFL